MIFSIKSFLVGSIATAACTIPLVTHAATPTTPASLSPGDVIKGSESTVYYLGTNGRRYMFPNEKTFLSWYPNFSNVKHVNDARLASIPFGHTAVTYRPGKQLVKLPRDPKVYAVDRGAILRPIPDEATAAAIFGADWNKNVDDLPEIWFANYRIGTPVHTIEEFSATVALAQNTTISEEKSLARIKTDAMTDGVNRGLIPSVITVNARQTITWTNLDSRPHQILGGDGWGSSALAQNQTYQTHFDQPGTYDFSDAIGRTDGGIVHVVGE